MLTPNLPHAIVGLLASALLDNALLENAVALVLQVVANVLQASVLKAAHLNHHKFLLVAHAVLIANAHQALVRQASAQKHNLVLYCLRLDKAS